eukprot:1114795-Pelagomonas_calceolata.AAC.1
MSFRTVSNVFTALHRERMLTVRETGLPSVAPSRERHGVLRRRLQWYFVGRSTHHTLSSIEPIPMPIPFREGLFLEFDAPLTKPRHNLIVKQLEQVRNEASFRLACIVKQLEQFRPRACEIEQPEYSIIQSCIPSFKTWSVTGKAKECKCQMNRAIATLPDLTEYYRTVAEPRIREAIRKRDEENRAGKAA